MTQLMKSPFMATRDLDPFDLLWKNFFDDSAKFSTLTNKISHPVDIYEEESGITFELAVVDLNKEDIQIEVSGQNLRIKYDKPTEVEERNHIYRGITRRSFDLAWKISSKFDLSKLEATLNKGLLKIYIPLSVEASQKPKLIEIK